jgi:cell division protein FtsI/penicillin-binding protein 2
MRLGYDSLDTWLRKFGFGSATGVGFPSEPAGDLKEWMPRVPDIDLANMGFGHGIRISPLQLAQAVGVIANGGVLAPLRLVKARRDPVVPGQVLFDPRPTVRVLDPSVASTLQDFMIGVIEEGTSTAAKTEWNCAGKSGTAQKPLPEPQKGYYTNRFFGTFAGYGPVPNPRYVITVILDEPAVPHYGGAACGPIFRHLFTALMLHDGTPPQRVLDGNTAPLQSRSRGSEQPEPGEFVLARNPFESDGNGN